MLPPVATAISRQRRRKRHPTLLERDNPIKKTQSAGSSRNPSNSAGVFHTIFIPNKKGLRRKPRKPLI